MPDEPLEPSDSDWGPSLDLSRQVFAGGDDPVLLCCSTAAPDVVVATPDLVYELTGNPGRVEAGIITFVLENGDQVQVELSTGAWSITGRQQLVGRKGIDLLIQWQGMSLEGALTWLAGRHGREVAFNMGVEYITLMLPGTAPPPAGT